MASQESGKEASGSDPSLAPKKRKKAVKEMNIRVIIRIRPLNTNELAHQEDIATEYDEDRREISVSSAAEPWTFDRVYGITTQQEPFYVDVGEDVVKNCLHGFNGTIFAYGQTGAGKSWSMEGSEEEPGIQRRAMQQLFSEVAKIKEAHPEQTFLIRVSYLEIYNDAVHDLLDDSEGSGAHALDDHKGQKSSDERRRTTKHNSEEATTRARAVSTHGDSRARALTAHGPTKMSSTADRAGSAPTKRIREDVKTKSFVVPELIERMVGSWEEVSACLKEGNQRRAVGSTNMNAVSSRSHAIFTCCIERDWGVVSVKAAETIDPATKSTKEQKKPASAVTVAKLNLVDLAGSERGAKTGAKGARAREGSYINKSLSALGDVITALEKKALSGSVKQHIPYRNSALTKLLADSLGGNSRTVMIAACGPALSNAEETISTLRFAARVKAVKNKPKINEDPKDTRLRELGEEIQRLKEEQEAAVLAALQSKKRDTDSMVESVKGKLLYKVAIKRLEKKEKQAAEDRTALTVTREEVEHLKRERDVALSASKAAKVLAESKDSEHERALIEVNRLAVEAAEVAEAEKKSLLKAEAKAAARASAAEEARVDCEERMVHALEEVDASRRQVTATEVTAAEATRRAEEAENYQNNLKVQIAEKEAASSAAAAALNDVEGKYEHLLQRFEGEMCALQEVLQEERKRGNENSAKVIKLQTLTQTMEEKLMESQATASMQATEAEMERVRIEQERAEDRAKATSTLQDVQEQAEEDKAKSAKELSTALATIEATKRAAEATNLSNEQRLKSLEQLVQDLRSEKQAVAEKAVADAAKLVDEAALRLAAGASAQDKEAQRANIAEANFAKTTAQVAALEKEILEVKAKLSLALDDKVANAAEAQAEIEKQAVELNALLDTSRSAEASALEKVEKLSQKLKLSESEKEEDVAELSKSLAETRSAEALATARVVEVEANMKRSEQSLQVKLETSKEQLATVESNYKVIESQFAEQKARASTLAAQTSAEVESLTSSLASSRESEAEAIKRAVAAELDLKGIKGFALTSSEKSEEIEKKLRDELASLTEGLSKSKQRELALERKRVDEEATAASNTQRYEDRLQALSVALKRVEETVRSKTSRLGDVEQELSALKLESALAAEQVAKDAEKKAAAAAAAAAASAETASSQATAVAVERIHELESKFRARETALVNKVKASEECITSLELDLDAKADECDQLAASRENDIRKFQEMRSKADESLSIAQNRIDALNRDLQNAWTEQGLLEQKTKLTSGLMRLSSLFDRHGGRMLRKYLLKWAESNISGFVPKTFPEQLGPFGFEQTSLTDKVVLYLQPESNVFTYQIPLHQEGPLSEIARRFGDKILDVGQLSPPHPITLSAQSRRFAGIPLEAVNVIWAYPLVGMSEVASNYQVELNNPAALFITFGGFIYTDMAGKVVSTAAIASDGEDQYFEPPLRWRNEYTAFLHRQGRFQEITLRPLAEEGAQYYAWIHAGEELVNYFDEYGNHQPAGVEKWKVSKHGAFCYLFNEPDAVEPDPRNKVFPVWGGTGDGEGSVDLREVFQKTLDRRSIAAFLDSDDDEDEDVEDDHNPEANSPIDPHLSLARSNAIANSSFNQRQSESQQSSRDNRHMAQSQVGGPPEKTFFQSTGKAIPPAPLEHSNDDSSSVHTDSLADRFNETVIQKVFDEGKLGFSLKKVAPDGVWPLVVGKVDDAGQARDQGVVVGSVIVELNNGKLLTTTSGREFVRSLSKVERPFLIGFREPLKVSDSGVKGESVSVRQISGSSRTVSFQEVDESCQVTKQKSVVGTKFRI